MSLPESRSIGLKKNNFDFLRIASAFVVLFSHHFVLVGMPPAYLPGIHELSGFLGVLVFFSISGYLVTKSWLNDPNPWRFVVRRVLRIWPALILLALLTTLVLGPAVTRLSLSDYLSQSGTWQYFDLLRLKVRQVLPGVFEQNPFANAVNGSLWTIPIEVKCYVGLLLIGLVGALRIRWLIPLLAIVLAVWFLGFKSPELLGKRSMSREFALFFLMGSALCYLQPIWEKHPMTYLSATLILTTVLSVMGWWFLGLVFALPCLVILFGSASTPVIRSVGRWGDISYGMYLYAFPIQQLVVHTTWPGISFWNSLVVSTVLTILLAYGSWHLIEKHALSHKPSRTTQKTA